MYDKDDKNLKNKIFHMYTEKDMNAYEIVNELKIDGLTQEDIGEIIDAIETKSNETETKNYLFIRAAIMIIVLLYMYVRNVDIYLIMSVALFGVLGTLYTVLVNPLRKNKN